MGQIKIEQTEFLCDRIYIRFFPFAILTLKKVIFFIDMFFLSIEQDWF